MPMMPSKGRGNEAADFPNITDMGGEHFLTGIKDGTRIGYKYIELRSAAGIRVTYRGHATGTLLIGTEREQKFSISILPADDWTDAETEVRFTEERELYFVYQGAGHMEMLSFTFFQ